MLAQALSGIRDVRVPLVTGGLWLLAIWMLAGSQVHALFAALDKNLSPTIDSAQVPHTVWIALFVLSAYVLGTVVTFPLGIGRVSSAYTARHLVVRDRIRDFLGPVLTKIGFSSALAESLTSGLYHSTYLDLIDRLHAEYPDWPPGHAQQCAYGLGLTVFSLVTPLRLHKEAIYANFDQIIAEAEFRANVAPALVLVAIALPGDQLLWRVLLYASAILLIAHAAAKFFGARSLVIETAIHGDIPGWPRKYVER